MNEMTERVANELSRIIQQVVAYLQPLPGVAAAVRPGPGKWSKQEIVGHLVDSALNNLPRFVRAQAVTSFYAPVYDQDSWVRLQGYQQAEWPALLGLWAGLNGQIAHMVRLIPAAALAHVCHIGDREPVTLGSLLEDYVAHLRHHMRQLGIEDQVF
ncbi:DinB family protein [Chitinophaga pendula]|uniref:DinB family protein n=1 Tax=Chitinophaga TaxID=79328 RepID=UPI000BB079FE|nr:MULTISPECIES: DinB family protein [Chitinophaga]ASZ13757.1 hypothetical protein CK934_23790 [Chitinophaga sp. MD30]UCJ08624.1 DinB family protein [Chitinophaga pendula]